MCKPYIGLCALISHGLSQEMCMRFNRDIRLARLYGIHPTILQHYKEELASLVLDGRAA